MGRLKDTAIAERREPGLPCSIGEMLRSLPKADRDDLADLLADKEVRHTNIARALTAIGHRITDQSVAHHRNGSCRCEPAG